MEKSAYKLYFEMCAVLSCCQRQNVNLQEKSANKNLKLQEKSANKMSRKSMIIEENDETTMNSQ